MRGASGRNQASNSIWQARLPDFGPKRPHTGLRSQRSGLSKEAFVATGIVIACMIDVSRLGVYSTRFLKSGLHDYLMLVIAATLSAFTGAYVGSRLLKKVTLSRIQIIVTVLLIILSIGIGSGLI